MLDLAAGLLDGLQVVLAIPDAPAARWLIGEGAALGVEIWPMPDAERAEMAAAFRARLASDRVDLVHVHAGITWEGHETAAAARLAGTWSVLRTEHCPYVLTKDEDARAYRRGIQAVDRILCVSEGVRRTFIESGVDEGTLRVVLNGIADRTARTSRAVTRAVLGVAESAPLAVTVARLTEQKGHHDLLAAVPSVLAAVPDARFVWIGDGPLEHSLRDAVRASGLEDVVRLQPRHEDVPALLAASDVVVLPSRFEGLPLVALEAMAAGRPVVGTAVVGLDETIRDGRTGRIVPVGDVRALAAALIAVLADPVTGRAWGEAGRSWQRTTFTAQQMVAGTAEIYRELLVRNRAEAPLSMAAAG